MRQATEQPLLSRWMDMRSRSFCFFCPSSHYVVNASPSIQSPCRTTAGILVVSDSVAPGNHTCRQNHRNLVLPVHFEHLTHGMYKQSFLAVGTSTMYRYVEYLVPGLNIMFTKNKVSNKSERDKIQFLRHQKRTR